MITDITNAELEVGDRVAYVVPKYSWLKVGIITKLTPNGATIDNKVNRQHCQMAKL